MKRFPLLCTSTSTLSSVTYTSLYRIAHNLIVYTCIEIPVFRAQRRQDSKLHTSEDTYHKICQLERSNIVCKKKL